MKNFKMKDLLVSIQPGNANNKEGRLIPERHFQEFPKCVQPSKSIPFAFAGVKEGPTKDSTEDMRSQMAGACPCPSKTTDEEPTNGKTAFNGNPHTAFGSETGAAALLELKMILAAMQTEAKTLR